MKSQQLSKSPRERSASSVSNVSSMSVSSSSSNCVDEFILALCGDGSVGKSSITTRFIQGTFDKQQIYDPTIEDAYYVKRNVDGLATQMEIIDTAGQEEYKALRSQYMRRSYGFVFVFDVTNGDSLKSLKDFFEQIQRIKMSDEDASSDGCGSLSSTPRCSDATMGSYMTTSSSILSSSMVSSSHDRSLSTSSNHSTISNSGSRYQNTSPRNGGNGHSTPFLHPTLNFPFIFVGNKIDLLLNNAHLADLPNPQRNSQQYLIHSQQQQPQTEKEKHQEKRDKKLLRKLDKEVRSYIIREILGLDETQHPDFVRHYQLPLYWTSAKENVNVEDCFDGLVREMRKFKALREMKTSPRGRDSERKGLSKLFGRNRENSSSSTNNQASTSTVPPIQLPNQEKGGVTTGGPPRRRWGSFSSNSSHASSTHATNQKQDSSRKKNGERSASYPSRRGSFLFASFNCDNDMDDLFP
ncbi:hypothetical protein C9374_012095 [Naegleria lovaniensis]|uniref:Ras family small GTPase n=1 Tax=Naegleria lovaniensis TaxID=51637 RepID=A0AA88KCQ6_NAELO|nr:uncharacterized protein C9374_012095 [Naegleria lovaniensis]KAG2373488.1 hypothetical protein C9374_012095 [Naegleria lovaniensis]